MVAGRIAREYLAQVVSFCVTLTDRLIIAAVLLRAWGVDDFAAWTMANAFAGITSVFTFGINLYFSNQLMFKIQGGHEGDDVRLYRAGNSYALIAAIIGFGVSIVALLVAGGGNPSVPLTETLVIGSAALAGALALRMAGVVQLSAYRAHSEFARQTNMLIALDLARIAFTVAAVLLGAQLMFVALGQLAITAMFVLIVFRRDIAKRYPRFIWRFGWLDGGERRDAVKVSLAYWFASGPSTVITYLPVLLLTFINATAFAIAQFALMRTISGFARTVLQQFSIVLSQEIARRFATGDADGVESTYRESANLLTVQTSVAAGLLIVVAAPLFGYWTGRTDLFDARLLWLSLAPIVLIPAMTLVENLFASANRPLSLAAGRATQMLLSVILFLLIPIGEDVVRLAVALAVAELLGMGIPVMITAARSIEAAGLVPNLLLLARGVACLAAVTLPTALLQRSLDLPPLVNLALTLALGLLLSAVLILFAGMGVNRRRQILAALKRMTSAFALARPPARG